MPPHTHSFVNEDKDACEEKAEALDSEALRARRAETHASVHLDARITHAIPSPSFLHPGHLGYITGGNRIYEIMSDCKGQTN
jgi:hypothetical protein